MKIAILTCGYKGALFVEHSAFPELKPHLVVTYEQDGDSANSYERIKKICKQHRISFHTSKKPDQQILQEYDVILAIGWQFLLPNGLLKKTIVFHDSLLPKYRGWAPTVTALIKGEKTIGVTALQPDETMDTGPIYGQESISITYPITIEEAFKKQNNLYHELTAKVVEDRQKNTLKSTQQKGISSYSIWRDAEDFRIDWTQSAEEVQRFIHALGFPYEGAFTIQNSRRLKVLDAEIVKDLTFEMRQPGKIFALEAGKPIVICGRGLLKLTKIHEEQGKKVMFDRLRLRFDA